MKIIGKYICVKTGFIILKVHLLKYAFFKIDVNQFKLNFLSYIILKGLTNER